MRSSRIKTKLAQNQPVLLTMLNTIDPSLFELTSLFGFDGIWVDLEHNNPTVETVAGLLRAARVGSADVLTRVAKGEFMRMGRLLEAGAAGIMYARCDNAAEAAEVVQWCKFAPLGKRGFCGGNADMPYCTVKLSDYIQHANEQTFVCIQLEDQNAVDNAYDIAKVPGVDVLFFGPADYSISSGIPGQFNHPKIQQAIETVAKAASAAKIHWGTVSSSPRHTETLLKQGARLISYLSDTVIFKKQLQQIQKQFEPLGFAFDNQLGPIDDSYLEMI
jgi:4-hydroxy-2-oxoheptanedioate aldolase